MGEEKAKPTVTKLRSTGLLDIDFLHAGTSASGHLVVACGSELSRLSPSTGEIVASWKGSEEHDAFTAFQAVSPHEVITCADKTVEIWDLRTADGLARIAKAPEVVTALDAGAFSSSSLTFFGDARGSLHRVDWRSTDMRASELLWSPPPQSVDSTASVLGYPCRKVMVQSGCVCLMGGGIMRMLAIEPCVVDLGFVSAPTFCLPVAVASGAEAWAFTTLDAAAGKIPQSTVVIVDMSGNNQKRQSKKEDTGAQKASKAKQKPKKAETQGKKPSSGKAAHGRNSGR